MSEKKTSLCFKIMITLVRAFYPKIEVVGAENLPAEPALIIANHTQMNGPIACELYFPTERYTWCAGEMMHLKDVPAYAYRDFWSRKPRWCRWFYHLLSYIIAPLSVELFTNANTIEAQRDARILSTFRETIARLQEGASIVIFPEQDKPHNHILCDFQTGFVDVARLYHRRTGRVLQFVPMYIAPALHKMYIGKPTAYRPDMPIDAERSRICNYLMDAVTATACSLPRHRVVPYRNIPKKNYPFNISSEV